MRVVRGERVFTRRGKGTRASLHPRAPLLDRARCATRPQARSDPRLTAAARSFTAGLLLRAAMQSRRGRVPYERYSCHVARRTPRRALSQGGVGTVPCRMLVSGRADDRCCLQGSICRSHGQAGCSCDVKRSHSRDNHDVLVPASFLRDPGPQAVGRKRLIFGRYPIAKVRPKSHSTTRRSTPSHRLPTSP